MSSDFFSSIGAVEVEHETGTKKNTTIEEQRNVVIDKIKRSRNTMFSDEKKRGAKSVYISKDKDLLIVRPVYGKTALTEKAGGFTIPKLKTHEELTKWVDETLETVYESINSGKLDDKIKEAREKEVAAMMKVQAVKKAKKEKEAKK